MAGRLEDLRQLGIVVRDANATMEAWVKLGVGPWYVTEFVPDDFVYRGRPAEAPRLKLCFAHSGGLQLELIEQLNDVPSAYADFLGHGLEGAQHVCAWFDHHARYDARRQDLIDRGLTVVHEGRSRGADARFAYFATDHPGGLMIELSEALTPRSAASIGRMERESLVWDGQTDPIRPFSPA